MNKPGETYEEQMEFLNSIPDKVIEDAAFDLFVKKMAKQFMVSERLMRARLGDSYKFKINEKNQNHRLG